MSGPSRHDATELAYQEIRRRILGNVYAPGAKLTETRIARSLRVSRTPVRSALVRLHVEGLVELLPNRGAFVASWTSEDIEEIFGLRLALEPLAASFAAHKIQPEETAQLRELATRMEVTLDEDDGSRDYVDETTELNAEFHRVLIVAARNQQLRSMLSSVIEFPLMHRTIAEFEPVRLRRAWREHRELIAAMETGDADLAAAVMLTHVLAARDVIRQMQSRGGREDSMAGAAPTA